MILEKHKHTISVILFLVALIPFAKVVLSSTPTHGILTTGAAVTAASDQYMAFLLKKDELFNYFMKHYDKGFFKFEEEANSLLSTYVTLESMSELGSLNDLPVTAQEEIVLAAKNYYKTNKHYNWFSPSYTYAYYGINQILGEKIVNEEELINLTFEYRINNSVFRSLSDAGKPSVLETYYALKLLSALEQDLTPVKRSVIDYINTDRQYDEEETYYITLIAELVGEQSEIPRSTLIGCVIKQYIPFVDSSNCAKLLKERNVLTYFPSGFLLLASYFMLTYKPHHRKD